MPDPPDASRETANHDRLTSWKEISAHLKVAARTAQRWEADHRVFVFPLMLPPLRERRDDIPVLIGHFAALVVEQNGWKARAFSQAALESLAGYAWPGNVRELRNVVERLLLLTDGEVGPDAVRATLAGPSRPLSDPGVGGGPLADRVAAFERGVLSGELARHGFRIAETARALGLERSHFYKKCQALGLDLKAVRARPGTDRAAPGGPD